MLPDDDDGDYFTLPDDNENYYFTLSDDDDDDCIFRCLMMIMTILRCLVMMMMTVLYAA